MIVTQRAGNRIFLKPEQIYQGNLLLVNATYPLRRIETRQLIPVDADYPNILLKRDAAHVLQLILEKIGGSGDIVPVSGYRSAEEQADIYGNSQKENGEEFTRKYVALPYHSEHQTGLAIDLGIRQEKIDFLCPDFPYQGICDRFRKTAPEYGFIQRYEKDKESITGISHEPWHFRYVGYPHSKIMAERGLSLEEYIEYIKAFREDCPYLFGQDTGTEIRIYYVPDRSGTGREEPDRIRMSDHAIYQISGNNTDGFIVTVWRA